jgi:hypothetical protein
VQTTKKWVVDAARKIDGRVRREEKTTKNAACVVDSLLSTAVHGDHHTTRVRVCGLDHNGDRGGSKGGEEQKFPGLTVLVGGKQNSAHVLDCLCSDMVLRNCVRLTDTYALLFSPTHPYDHRTKEATQKTSRQRREAG